MTAADGNWSLIVVTPLGERRGKLSLKAEGNALSGSQLADDGSAAGIFDGTVNGSEVFWKVSITDPMPMTLEFAGTINEDEIFGTVKLGEFGNSSFSGNRS
jgi:hypothetical protein